MKVIECKKLTKSYGSKLVLNDIDLSVNQGEFFGLVGMNGGGKSTMINTISGINQPRSGQITFMDERIDGKQPHFIVEKGIVQVPEGRRIFSSLTVLENLEMGSFLPRAKKRRKEVLNRILPWQG